METDLTKAIKKRLHAFRPSMNSNMRTIRWAEEVTTPSGIVDVIRFEDYVEKDSSYCARLTPSEDDRASPLFRPDMPVGCKIEDKTFPCANCNGCCYKRTRYELGILTTCYEVKISLSDFKSKNGHNFNGNLNYYAVPIKLVDKIKYLVPASIGIIAYYPESGHMVIKKDCEWEFIKDDALSYLLYNALKKWVDHM